MDALDKRILQLEEKLAARDIMIAKLLSLIANHSVQIEKLIAENAELKAENEVLKADNAVLKSENAELKRRLNLNSQNSSKPPSSDGLKKPPTKSLREKSGKKSGGQEGHKGDTLRQVAQPDEVIVHALSNCPVCHEDISNNEVIAVQKRHVFDIPEPKIEVTEHQVETKHCHHCKKKVSANFPLDVLGPTQYGPRIQALCVYMRQGQFTPEDRLSDFFQDVFGLSISATCIMKHVSDFSEKIEPLTNQYQAGLSASPMRHLDESGLKVSGKLHWIHVISNHKLTHYNTSDSFKQQ